MRNIRHLSHIETLIRRSGITLENVPSIHHPIPVAVFYRTSADGTLNSFWPQGNRETALSSVYNRSSRFFKWACLLYALFLTMGLDRFLAHGRLVIYTDLPTATYLQQQWPGVQDSLLLNSL